MRVSLTPLDGGAPIDLSDGTDLNPWPRDGEVWGLERAGLEGWFEPPSVRMEVESIPQRDGAYLPALAPLEHRVVTVRGFHTSRFAGGSEAATTAARDLLASLATRHVQLRIEDASGPRYCTGIFAQTPVIEHVNAVTTKFALFIVCADPRKYSEPITYQLANASVSTVTLENLGTAPSYPVIDIKGTVQFMRLTLAGQVIWWSGDAGALHIDCFDGQPIGALGYITGEMLRDDLIELPPGRFVARLERSPATSKAQISAMSAWR